MNVKGDEVFLEKKIVGLDCFDGVTSIISGLGNKWPCKIGSFAM